MPYLQELIYKLEVGPWGRHLIKLVLVLMLTALFGGYNLRGYKNMNSEEAMDSAQVARNVAEGKGFKTQYIRPLSIYLVKSHNEKVGSPGSAEGAPDYARLIEPHPDLANPPVYPLVLAGWMKVYPLILGAADGIREIMPGAIKRRLPNFNDDMDNRLWQQDKRFWWHPHDFLIALFNQAIFFAVILLNYRLALRLFDLTVARLSAVCLLGFELLWRFSVSGLSTMLLLLIFTGLIWCVVLFESEVREPKGGHRRLLLLAGMAGLLIGLGTLTLYSFGWMLFPVMVYMGVLGGQKRAGYCGLALGVFLVVLSPWIYRNISVSGTPFGVSGYAVLQGAVFGGNHLERSLNPDFDVNLVKPIARKLVVNSRNILQSEVPKLAGSWVTPLFLVGLMLGFNNPAIRRLRFFILGSLVMLIVVQALGRTHLSDDSPEINSENLLVLLSPLVLVYSVSLFFVLFEQLNLALPILRYAVVGSFAALVCMPMISALLPPRGIAVAYPPYYPPRIEIAAGWMKENELMMSDIPWGVAWYGKQQCLLMTLDAQDTFFAVNDFLRPIRAIYLTELTMDGRFISDWFKSGERSWGTFIIQGVLSNRIPGSFPLRIAPPREDYHFLPEQLFLTDWERWKAGAETQ